MTEDRIDLADDQAGIDASDVGVKTYGASDDHLATTKLPSAAGGRPPLPPARVPSVPPTGIASSASAGYAPFSPSGLPPVGVLPPASSPAPAVDVPRAAPVPRPGQSSWWRALLVSTRPPANPSAETAALDDRAARERIAAAAISLGLVIMLLALVVGLHEAPTSLLMAPVVAASVVLGRAAVAVAMFVVGLSCLRAAERIYFR